MLKEHIKRAQCCPGLKWEEQYMIYDRKLILQWIREGFIPLEVVKMYAIGFVEERARELGKVKAWRVETLL
jgi:hypothetical protein